MMVAWVTGSVLISKTNFMPETLKGEALLRAKGGEGKALLSDGGPLREEGSAGTIGLGTIFRTHGKAHDLQVRGK